MHYAKQAADKVEKAASRLARNYKVDDMRLFCSAMEVVFQAVVDDIVSQGGEVTRVEATNRGFFEGPEGAPTPAPRTSDAAMAEV